MVTITVQETKNHHIQSFFFLVKIFFEFWFSYKFQTKAAVTFAHVSTLFSHIEFTIQILSKSITCHFQFFELFWVILTAKIWSENLILRVRYSFGTLFNILRG